MKKKSVPAAAAVAPVADLNDDDLDDVATSPALVGVISLSVPFSAIDERLDAFIAAAEPRLSRSRAANLIDDGVVTIDGALPKKSGVKLRGGEQIVITVPPPAATTLIAQDLPLNIVLSLIHI